MASTLTEASISSTTSQMSVEPVSSDKFRTQLGSLITNEERLSTIEAVHKAEAAIEWLKTIQDPIRYLNFPQRPVPQLDYAKLLEAMLQFSQISGGQRYTACAIWFCYLEGTADGSRAHNLTALGLMWLAYLLYPFKSSGNARTKFSDVISGAATPTLEKKTEQLTSGLPNDQPDQTSFANLLLERDGYNCVATGYWSTNDQAKVLELWANNSDIGNITGATPTEGAHIFRRAVAIFETSPSNEAQRENYLDSISTWDIIRNYGAFTDDMVQNLDRIIDSPENGITLSLGLDKQFDNFQWCFIPKGGDDDRVWVTKHFLKDSRMKIPGLLEEVVFRDASVTAPTQSKRAPHGIKLPNAAFIRLHSAICHVLHLSGAADILDEYIKRYEKEDPGVPSGDTFLIWLALAHIEVAESSNIRNQHGAWQQGYSPDQDRKTS